MRSPFRIEGPAVVSFSGGRTSALMLRRILDEGLQPDVHNLFANTGKEREETLEFVDEVGRRWGAPIVWAERTGKGSSEIVNFLSASRDGEPFADLITERGMCPGWRQRFCTVELKIEPMRHWMKAQGYAEWTNVVGIRADEPRRVAKLSGKREKEWDYQLPLADAGTTERDVMAFWAEQPFDLRLKSYEGNCDLCFLKSRDKVVRIMRDRPGSAEWWIEQERRTGTTFRLDRPDFATLQRLDAAQDRLFDDSDLIDCMCHEGTTEAA